MALPHISWSQVPQHRSIIITDITGFGRWTNQTQLQARAVLHTAARFAFATAGARPAQLVVEDRGDGMIVLVSAQVSKVSLLDPLIPALAAAIGRHNAEAATSNRIRLKVAIHAGEIHYDRNGWVGTDINLACRLINSPALHQHPQANVILIVSDLIHTSIVQHGYRRIDPTTYTAVQVTAKEVNARAWLHIPTDKGLGRLPRRVPWVSRTISMASRISLRSASLLMPHKKRDRRV